MVARRRIAKADGLAAVVDWLNNGPSTPPFQVAQAVRFTLEELAAVAPGSAVEVRVPPFGAVQCLGGPHHTRGTPPNTVEADPAVWLGLALGSLSWHNAVGSAGLQASGPRADLSHILPLDLPTDRPLDMPTDRPLNLPAD
jgi:hypothetical protein